VKCELCERTAVGGLCEYHEEAKRRVEANFSRWKNAYGSLGWSEYLDKIKRNPETGQWAKEAASFLGKRNDKKVH